MSKRKSTLTDYEITQAKVAKSINWNVIGNWQAKLGASCPLEMAIDYDSGAYFEMRKLNMGPFHRHVRINIDKMLFAGCYSPSDVVDLLYMFKQKGGTLKQLNKSEDDENYEESDD